MFLEKKVPKSGVNTYSKYDYWTLGDITPPILEIFTELNLFGQITFTEDMATLILYDLDESGTELRYSIPLVLGELKASNATQNLGAAVTYLRRYLYLLAFDIVEQDELDANTGRPESKRPASPQKRAEIKEEVTKIDDQAGALLLKSLTQKAKELYGVKGNKAYVDRISKETEKFTVVSKARANELILEINKRLEGDKD